MTQIAFTDLLTQEFKRNPIPLFTELRSKEPLTHFPMPNGIQGWLVTRYKDIEDILRNPRFVKDIRKVQLGETIIVDDAFRVLANHMLVSDPPDHTRLRSIVSKAFTPKRIEQMRNRIQQITDELLDAVQEKGRMELISDFAFPLPITVISELLGIPVSDRAKFREWSTKMTQNAGLFQTMTGTEEATAFVEYLRALIAKRRMYPVDDLVTGLVQAEEAGDKLSENELIAMVFLLIVAGHETTVNLIGNGTLALLQHPEQMRKLQQNPGLTNSAVEELLRYTSPVAMGTVRYVAEDVEMHGKVIPKNSVVLLALMSANTDAEAFANPDELDIAREENKHLAFGKGIHFCLGAPLARLEGQIAFPTLLRRMPDLRLDADADELVWRPSLVLRGITTLPVVW